MRVWRTISLLYFGTYTIIILQFMQGIVLTGPVITRSIRMVREVYPEIEADKHEGNQAEVCIVGDVVYGVDEAVPSSQPCLKCHCRPPGIHCEDIQCSQKQGCKAIHKSNQCCPEYQCECVHNGTSYANGERLPTLTGGECKVCYCRGGEVQCADVSCYKRTDCEGHTVPGQCCPKYDHCPLKEPLVPRVVSTTLNTSSAPISDLQEDIINITDTDSTTTDTFVSVQSTTTPADFADDLNITNLLENTPPEVVSNITIQEIIPAVKEIPITTAPKQNKNVMFPKTQIIVSQTLDENDNLTTNDLLVTDADSESSEISEIFHQPPPVLKIGNQFLVFKKGELVTGKDLSTPVPVITIIGAEGLQRGTEDSSEFHDITSQLHGPQKDFGNFDDFFGNDTLETPNKETHIISFVRPKTTTISSTVEPFTDLPLDLLEFQDASLEETYNRTPSEDDDVQTDELENPDNTTKVELLSLAILQSSVPATTEEKLSEVNDTKTEQKHEGSVMQRFDSNGYSSTAESSNTLENETSAKSNGTTTKVPAISIVAEDTTQTPNNSTTVYYSAHILINTNATLPSVLLKQPAASDTEEEMITEYLHEIPTPLSKDKVIKVSAKNNYSTLDDSGESTTARSNQTSESTFDNASIETTENSSQELNTTDMVEILPGFHITTTDSETEKRNLSNETDTQRLSTTLAPPPNALNTDSLISSDNFINQLNLELNDTISSLNLTALQSNNSGAEAIFKELLHDVNFSTAPPNLEESIQLHEKETLLLQKVSEAISEFQNKESREALDARIMAILKDFFSTQRKTDNTKTQKVASYSPSVVK